MVVIALNQFFSGNAGTWPMKIANFGRIA
jgi:hypothetical protein